MIDILIVDNSAAIRKILQRVLREADMPVGEVFEAGDGREALARLATSKVGLVLSDMHLPNMDGLALLAHLKSSEEWKSLPVVMTSREGNRAKVMEAVALGAAGYLRTPFHADQVKQKLAEFF